MGSKGCKKWVWLALDTATWEIVGVFVGSRGKAGAKGLWQSLPTVYRQCAVLYTDFWKAYAEVFPSKRHQAVGKSSGRTNHIERFNCTLRQRTGPEGAALSKTARFTPCPQHVVVLKKAGEPHWCYLDLRSPLQRILTPLGLPY